MRGSDYARLGWRGGHNRRGEDVPGLSATEYALQLSVSAEMLRQCVDVAFTYCSGGVYGWQSFEMAMIPESERQVLGRLLTERYEVYGLQMGFLALANAMRKLGIDPGEAIGPEVPHSFVDSFVATTQETTTGKFLWLKETNQSLFSGKNGRLTFYNGGDLFTTVKGV